MLPSVAVVPREMDSRSPLLPLERCWPSDYLPVPVVGCVFRRTGPNLLHRTMGELARHVIVVTGDDGALRRSLPPFFLGPVAR